VNAFSLHLAPNAPWLWLGLASLVLAGLAIWAYRFGVPPLSAATRRTLGVLRALVLLLLVWLLAQPVLERASAGRAARVTVLVDRSASMDLPAGVGVTETRAARAERIAAALRQAWRGRADVTVRGFASRLATDSLDAGERSATALGDALAQLPAATGDEPLDGVVVVSDGVVNAGEDPAHAAQALGIPVNAVLVGGSGVGDRAVLEVETPPRARVGEPTPVRVHVASSEPRGTAIPVRLMDGDRELARRTVPAPGPGLEALATFEIPPAHQGLAVWTAAVDSLPGQLTTTNDAREAAIEVAPGRLGVLIVTAGLNWDVSFLRRALAGDSSLSIDTRVRERNGWTGIESARAGVPTPADLRQRAVVVLDGIAAGEVSPAFDAALAEFVRGGGGLILLGGGPPGLPRYRTGTTGERIGIAITPQPLPRLVNPAPTPEGNELLAWDDDPARGEQAWREAPALVDPAPVTATAADRVLVAGANVRTPLLFVRRVGRGQVLMVNGGGFWRWSLSPTDEHASERSTRMWRRLARWLAEPVQGEPLRVRPERWVSPAGERVRLFASLQDSAFRPVRGARVEAEVRDARGRRVPASFSEGNPGSYVASLGDLAAGRYSVSARAVAGGRELGRANSEFAVDRWSLEGARVEPDRATLAAMAAAGGGRVMETQEAERWARGTTPRALARVPTRTVRLWESPWVFALAVAALSTEWIWRRRRGLP
jgi:hypothetical protein